MAANSNKRQFAAAIKAAPSSADQHKVAFTIQQLLRLLDNNSATPEAFVAVDIPVVSSARYPLKLKVKGSLHQVFGVLYSLLCMTLMIGVWA